MRISTLGAFGFIVFQNVAFAQTPPAAPVASSAPTVKMQKPPVDSHRLLRIIYGSTAWNLDSSKIDSAFLFLRDAKSGRILKILLEETEPDSSNFQGDFAIGWSENSEVNAEVYIPPKGLRSDEKAIALFSKMLGEERIKKMPVVFKKGDSGEQILDVYDTREQAERALKAYTQKRKLEESQAKLTRPVVSASTLQLAEQTRQQALLNKLAQAAAQREAERIRLEQIERQKAEERRRQAEALAAEERERRREEAQDLVRKAMAAYDGGEFSLARDLFQKAVELDPANTTYYYKYGVSLYRTDRFNEALVTLKLAQDTPDIAMEKKYYMALIHYRLKELEPAKAAFREVRQSQIPVLAPSAAFYEGVILFGEENLEAAKGSFEYVLDTSEDAVMDRKAEEYIEKILQIQMFQKMASVKHLGRVTLGIMYDDNVLYAPDTVESQGETTGRGGARLMGSADVEYRFRYRREDEFSTKFSAMTLYSLDSDFARADPLIANVTLPYAWKGTWNDKGYKFTVAPGYESLFMATATEEVTYPGGLLLSSPLVRLDATLIMRPTWFANYFFEARFDDSLDPTSSGTLDSDAQKFSLRTTHTFFLRDDKKTALIANGGYVLNQALGRDRKYERIEIGLTYTAPFRKWDASWLAGLSAYNLDFPSSTNDRLDRNLGVMLGLNKPLGPKWLASAMANYVNNASSVPESFQYSKFTVFTTLSYRWNQ